MYTAETVFGEDEVASLQTPVQFNGTAHAGHIDERMVNLSKKIKNNSYEGRISERRLVCLRRTCS